MRIALNIIVYLLLYLICKLNFILVPQYRWWYSKKGGGEVRHDAKVSSLGVQDR